MLDLDPLDVERLLAGALRREERVEEHVMRLLLAVMAPYLKTQPRLDDLIGRAPGTSRVPGYREPPRG